MRLSTHVIFALGVTTLSASYGGVSMIDVLILWGLVSLQQILIDKLSHEFRGKYRTPLFHSFTGASILSLALASLPPALSPMDYNRGQVLVYMTSLLLSGWSHLFLDSLNPGGIYILGKRVRIAKIRYDDPVANTFFQMLGLLMVVYSMSLRLGA
ncbi:MAG: DUF1286 domain-containing protein [Desulfurococcales archaeon]|nr:DUF1286 domain-containing protein [Desulfurococcales archaeon]MCE4605605.1 DUF1286 domain-containing protein [Desulfurococcales archaeon]